MNDGMYTSEVLCSEIHMENAKLRPLCNGLTDLFFSETKKDKASAIRICKICPLRNDCYQRGVSSMSSVRTFQGIWGGVDINAERDREQKAKWRSQHVK